MTSSTEKPEKCAAVSLVIRPPLDMPGEVDEILCVWNRRYGTWSLPGGLVEPGEEIEAGQRRELEEEVGMLTMAAKEVHRGPAVTGNEDRAGTVVLFLVYAVGEPREMEEGCPVRWMTVRLFLAESKFHAFYAPVLERIVTKAREERLAP